MSDACHCGRPANPERGRGMCGPCDDSRCDAYPLECPYGCTGAPRSDDTTPAEGRDAQDAPDASTGRTRDQAHQAAHHAQTQGGQAGIATGLAAIALAILAGQEPRP